MPVSKEDLLRQYQQRAGALNQFTQENLGYNPNLRATDDAAALGAQRGAIAREIGQQQQGGGLTNALTDYLFGSTSADNTQFDTTGRGAAIDQQAGQAQTYAQELEQQTPEQLLETINKRLEGQDPSVGAAPESLLDKTLSALNPFSDANAGERIDQGGVYSSGIYDDAANWNNARLAGVPQHVGFVDDPDDITESAATNPDDPYGGRFFNPDRQQPTQGYTDLATYYTGKGRDLGRGAAERARMAAENAKLRQEAASRGFNFGGQDGLAPVSGSVPPIQGVPNPNVGAAPQGFFDKAKDAVNPISGAAASTIAPAAALASIPNPHLAGQSGFAPAFAGLAGQQGSSAVAAPTQVRHASLSGAPTQYYDKGVLGLGSGFEQYTPEQRADNINAAADAIARRGGPREFGATRVETDDQGNNFYTASQWDQGASQQGTDFTNIGPSANPVVQEYQQDYQRDDSDDHWTQTDHHVVNESGSKVDAGYGQGEVDPALARAAGYTQPAQQEDDSDSGGGGGK